MSGSRASVQQGNGTACIWIIEKSVIAIKVLLRFSVVPMLFRNPQMVKKLKNNP